MHVKIYVSFKMDKCTINVCIMDDWILIGKDVCECKNVRKKIIFVSMEVHWNLWVANTLGARNFPGGVYYSEVLYAEVCNYMGYRILKMCSNRGAYYSVSKFW